MKRATDPEFSLMRRVLASLEPLNQEAQRRIVAYLAARVEAGLAPPPPAPPSPPGPLLAAMGQDEGIPT